MREEERGRMIGREDRKGGRERRERGGMGEANWRRRMDVRAIKRNMGKSRRGKGKYSSVGKERRRRV